MFKVLQYLLIEHCMLKSMFPLIYFAKDTFILLTRHFHSKVIFYETMKWANKYFLYWESYKNIPFEAAHRESMWSFVGLWKWELNSTRNMKALPSTYLVLGSLRKTPQLSSQPLCGCPWQCRNDWGWPGWFSQTAWNRTAKVSWSRHWITVEQMVGFLLTPTWLLRNLPRRQWEPSLQMCLALLRVAPEQLVLQKESISW